LNGGVLFRENGEGVEQLVVPKNLQAEVLRKIHNLGHFGVHKMESLTNQQYYIPGMKDKIQQIIQSCVDCILGNKKAGKQEGLLNPIDKGDAPLQTFHVDHLTPAAGTRKGYQHLFVVIDAFTKYVWLYPTKTLNTNEVLSCLDRQQTNFGNPGRIISDRGSAFTSSDFADYCKSENIQHSRITTGVPRGNGQVERINRVVINLLTKLTPEDKPDQWFKHVRKIQQFINATMSRGTGFTPFELLFGVKMKLQDYENLTELIKEELEILFAENRCEMRSEARKQLLKISEENRRTYNKKRKPAHVYNLGDIVAIKKTQYGGSKISRSFFGPYKITKVNGKDRYDVVKIGSHPGPTTTSTSADNMKMFVDGEPLSDSTEIISSDSEEDFRGFTREEIGKKSGRFLGQDGRGVDPKSPPIN
jgi:transposase InsO family protein